ncbi:MAG: hypothetical protein ACR652_20505 [Methylocystis sp.]|uniref:hypothetical protein n=1 Tax=Methylocystis sp. TaxID=1911079 RepID=UPI003DA3F655
MDRMDGPRQPWSRRDAREAAPDWMAANGRPDIAAEASSGAAPASDDEEIWSRPARAPVRRDPPSGARDRWPIVATIVAIIIGATALIAMRERIVRILPPAAVGYRALGLPVNLAGLELREVRSRIEMDGARRILVVEGEVANLRRDTNRVPPLALAVRDSGGLQRYAWTSPSPKSRLDAGESIAFRARLASPPDDGVDVLVRFARLDETKKASAK